MVELELLEEKEASDFFDDQEEVNEFETAEQLKSESKEIPEIIVSGSDWTTETIFNQLIRRNIDLNPRFQRRDAWDKKRKSRFIESIILGLPIPQIVLADTKERGKYIVLDGKQRLLTILQFYGESATGNNKFALTGLEFRPELNGHNYESIKENIELNQLLFNLDNQTIRTILIRNWRTESLLYKIFLRLNMENTPLSAQELRQALHPGKFVSFLDDRSVESHILKKIFKSKSAANGDLRMRDVELLLRYVAFHYFLPKYDGNIKGFLNMTCEVLNKEWDEKEDDIRNVVNQFENAVEATIFIFGDKNFSHVWDTETYRKQFNRATLDVMTFYFCDETIRESAKKNKQNVEATFKKVCSSPNNGFRESVSGTTDVLGTYTRLSLWGKALLEVLDVSFNVPELIGDRIVFNGLR